LGLWLANPDVDALVLPPDLVKALKARQDAHGHLMAFAPWYRRNVLRWIAAAKQSVTHAARIELSASLAAERSRVPQF